MIKAIHDLTIDKEFKELIRPLYQQEYAQLEANILSDGCRNPITVWNGVIIDGHNRYEICTKHGIPFEIEEMHFDYREEAIAWICANQLGRRNLTEETRKFLIGMQYESEKIVNSKKNVHGINQYSSPLSATLPYEIGKPEVIPSTSRRTAKKIADANHISHGTVEKYAVYTRALEEIGKKDPKIVTKILSGQYKVSHNGVLDLANLPAAEVQRISRSLEHDSQEFAKYQKTRQEIQKAKTKDSRTILDGPSIKDMPAFDPDAEVTGLILTIPSWRSSISRVLNSADLTIITDSARIKLSKALTDLQDAILEIRKIITEE